MTDFQRIIRPRIAVSRQLLPPIEARMAELFECLFNEDDQPMAAEAMIASMQGCDVFVPTVTDTIDAALIGTMPASIKMIARSAVEAPVAIFRVYCSWPGVSAIMNLRRSVEK